MGTEDRSGETDMDASLASMGEPSRWECSFMAWNLPPLEFRNNFVWIGVRAGSSNETLDSLVIQAPLFCTSVRLPNGYFAFVRISLAIP